MMNLTEMTRDELLAQPEVVNIPADIMAQHSNEFIASTIATLRASRAAAEAQAEAEAEERRNWTAPEWLIHDPEHSEPGKRAYRTEDGYTARPGNNTGRTRGGSGYSGWHVRMVSGADTEHHTTLRNIVKAIEFDRAQPRNHRARR
jgi:hypothetical protein